jgi:F420-non-reducing hydrogenase iron-sulfur subunit
MARSFIPDVVVEICHHCVPAAGALPQQWSQAGALVVSQELPCSGKIEMQYLLRALAEVRSGICVVACPRGQCRLAQGNLRAEMRVGTLHKLLAEIGLEPERVKLLHCDPNASAESFAAGVRAAVDRLASLGPNPAVGPVARPGSVGPQKPRGSVGTVSAARLEPTSAHAATVYSRQH